MKWKPIRMTKRGQVTIPAAFRAELGWDQTDRVVLRREGRRVVLMRPEDLVSELYRSLAAYTNPANKHRDIQELIDEEREAFEQGVADESLETMARIDGYSDESRFHPVTENGQVTIPARVRQALGLRAGDQVGFLKQGDDFMLVRPEDIVRRTAGSMAEYRLPRPLTIEEEDEAYQQGVADENSQ
jgi:antitoxin PrlF